MANYDNDPNMGLPDKRKVGRTTSAVNAPDIATPANYNSISAMRTRLAAINGAYYTTAKLNQLSKNDMIHAIRTNDDSAGI